MKIKNIKRQPVRKVVGIKGIFNKNIITLLILILLLIILLKKKIINHFIKLYQLLQK